MLKRGFKYLINPNTTNPFEWFYVSSSIISSYFLNFFATYLQNQPCAGTCFNVSLGGSSILPYTSWWEEVGLKIWFRYLYQRQSNIKLWFPMISSVLRYWYGWRWEYLLSSLFWWITCKGATWGSIISYFIIVECMLKIFRATLKLHQAPLWKDTHVSCSHLAIGGSKPLFFNTSTIFFMLQYQDSSLT